MKKKISCILPVRGHSLYLHKSIQSILDQTFKDFELIILDHNNKKKIVEILNFYKSKDNRIKVIRLNKANLAELLNHGIKIAQGTYIARQDADDISHPNRFYRQLKWFNKKKILCGINSYKIDKHDKIIGKINNPIKHNLILKAMYYKNPFIHSSVMFKKSLFSKKVNYNKYFNYAQDFELWSRIYEKGIMGNLNEKLHYFRLNKESIIYKKKKDQNKYFIISAINYYLKKKYNKNLKFSKNLDVELKNIKKMKFLSEQLNFLKFLYFKNPTDKNFFSLIDFKFLTLFICAQNPIFILTLFKRFVYLLNRSINLKK